jgi:hypothetical protein
MRAVGRARTEDALLCPGGVSAWMYAQNVATCAIEPGDDNDLIAGMKAPETFEHLRFEQTARLRAPLRRLAEGLMRDP